jgi:replicative DNA helicase
LANDEIFTTVYLLAHDKQFARQNTSAAPSLFPRGAMRYIVDLAKRTWSDHNAPLDAFFVATRVQSETVQLRKAGVSAQQVIQAYETLLDLYAGVMAVDRYHIYRDSCRKWLERRSAALAIEKAGEALDDDDEEAAKAILDRAWLPKGDSAKRTILGPSSKDFVQRLRKRKKGAIPTGLADIDKLWEGGYRPSDVGIVLGSTGVGKSMLLCFLAAEAYWAGASVLYYTYELTREQIRDRIALGILQKGKLDLKGTWDAELTKAAKRRKLTDPPVAEIDIRDGESALTWPELSADLEAYKDEHGKYPDVLILDSADDIAPINKRAAGHEDLKDAYIYLRNLAQEKKLRVWTSGQLTRDAVAKARVSLRQVGGAYAKAQKVHYVIAFSQTEDEKTHPDGPFITIDVLKDSLHGTTGALLEARTEFGRGINGFPGIEVTQSHNLPIVMREEDDD